MVCTSAMSTAVRGFDACAPPPAVEAKSIASNASPCPTVSRGSVVRMATRSPLSLFLAGRGERRAANWVEFVFRQAPQAPQAARRHLIERCGMHLRIGQREIQRDTVAVRCTGIGTFRAPRCWQAPTHRSYKLAAMEFFEVRRPPHLPPPERFWYGLAAAPARWRAERLSDGGRLNTPGSPPTDSCPTVACVGNTTGVRQPRYRPAARADPDEPALSTTDSGGAMSNALRRCLGQARFDVHPPH
jgi:hypothetical protein